MGEWDDSKTLYRNIPAVPSEAGAEWSVYRVKTKGSTYDLALHRPANGRPLAALSNTRHTKDANQMRQAQDSAPLAGRRPLFDAKHHGEWIGQTLSVGAITTSAVQSVEPETDSAIVHTIVSEVTGVKGVVAAPAQAAPAVVQNPSAPPPPPYPEDCVIYAERIVRMMTYLGDHPTLFADARANPAFERRLRGSLEMASAVLQVLVHRARE
jgi:hypothetical protein